MIRKEKYNKIKRVDNFLEIVYLMDIKEEMKNYGCFFY